MLAWYSKSIPRLESLHRILSHFTLVAVASTSLMRKSMLIAKTTSVAQPKSKKLSFYWSPTKQMFTCDNVGIENQSSTPTNPSHDLAHLIVAANGGLPWLPKGERHLICLAEYNAVLLENLFDKTCNAVVFGTFASHETLAETHKYMDWFVNEHYAPFPISAEAAYQCFCYQVNPFIITRLFPYYLIDFGHYMSTKLTVYLN